MRKLGENYGPQEGSEDVKPQIKLHNKSYYTKWIAWAGFIVGVVFLFLIILLLNKRAKKRKNIVKKLASTSPQTKNEDNVEVFQPVTQNRSELVFFVEEGERFALEDLLEAEAGLRSHGLWSSLYVVRLKDNEDGVFAVKRLKKLNASFEEFGERMRRIGSLKHPNILPLVGFNSSDKEKLLFYRYQAKGSLLTLFENYIEEKRDFPWKLRLSIAVRIARGLNFLHRCIEDSSETIPHGNIKLTNILLNENEEPLISEYGYSEFLDHPSTSSMLSASRYTTPEKHLTEEADVYSFGVILLELLTGKLEEKSGVDLPKWVRSMVKEEWTGEVFDEEVAKYEMFSFPLLNVALKCAAHQPAERPNMAEVLEKIEEIVNAQQDVELDE